MKRIVLIAFKKFTKEHYLKKLNEFLGKYVTVEGFSVEEGINDIGVADLVLFTGLGVAEPFKKKIMENTEIIYMRRTYTKQSIKKLLKIPSGTTAMFVCNEMISAVESISILNSIGIKHIDLVPVYPNMEIVPNLKYAITPAQIEYVPEGVEHIVDIGWRVIDTATMIDLVTKLGIVNKAINNEIAMRQKEIMPINFGLQYMFENSNMVLEMTNEGVVYTDEEFMINDYNDSMMKIIPMTQYIGTNIFDSIIPHENAPVFEKSGIVNKVLFKHPIFEKTFEVTKKPLTVDERRYGYIFLIEDVSEVKALEVRLKELHISRGYVTKYSFEDILGESEAIESCKAKAKKIAVSDNVVLLIGESGTGKELFAQSIHNASLRKNEPFLAINCSALYPQLLESELFGYEEGAFSGAKKGGKKGLFELADKGTLFLDEIGELPMSVQAKFLRILQEKELIRVGGSEIITVDVRIIAATNRRLTKLIEEKKFRKDLYYRLSIFPLLIPTLKERREDILYLIDRFMKDCKAEEKVLSSELIHFLIHYSWPGNIRELKNCIEYMAFMGEKFLDMPDLPPSIILEESSNQQTICKEVQFPDLIGAESEVAYFILKTLSFKAMGRRALLDEADKIGYAVSEYKVRNVMAYLTKNGFIAYETGRKGAVLTEAGRAFIR